MHKYFLLITCFLYAITAQSQQADLDKKKFTVEYLVLPTTSTLSYFDKYSTDFFTDQEVVNNLKLKPATINSFFQLDGYEYTEDVAQFNYSIKIEKAQVLQQNILEKSETIKNVNGTTTIVKRYTATCAAIIPTTLSIKLIPYGTDLYTSVFAGNTDPIVYQSTPQTTRELAQQILNTKTGGIPSCIHSTYIQLLENKIQLLKSTCCFTIDSSKVFLLTINEKDTTQYKKFNDSVMESVIVLQNIKYNIPLDEARRQMEPILAYWSENIPTNSSAKHYKKLLYAHLWNLAVCQFYLEYLDDCEKTCQLLINNDFNKNEAEELLNNSKMVRASFKNSTQQSRHINRPGFTSQSHYQYLPASQKK
ncbi:MAG: hypothetical protein ACTHJT_03285 [Cytophaga sp.]|uniref:hypothetical protein n=1 Tax=Cytophaga sp. TaxID=29535 RepID=UPI003F7EA94A